ncbi:MAG: hypothetical protein AB7M93_26115 [Candidatus Obscuribacterales bacterium]
MSDRSELRVNSLYLVINPQEGWGDITAGLKIAQCFQRHLPSIKITVGIYDPNDTMEDNREAKIGLFSKHNISVCNIDSELKDFSEWIESTKNHDLQITFPEVDELLWATANGVSTLMLSEYNTKFCLPPKGFERWVQCGSLGIPEDQDEQPNLMHMGLLFQPPSQVPSDLPPQKGVFLCYASTEESRKQFVSGVAALPDWQNMDFTVVIPGCEISSAFGEGLASDIQIRTKEGYERSSNRTSHVITIDIETRSREDMQVLWQTSEPLCLCTGDQSWTEAVQFNKRFVYESTPHKADLAKAIQAHYGKCVIWLTESFDFKYLPDPETYTEMNRKLLNGWNAWPLITEECLALDRANLYNAIGKSDPFDQFEDFDGLIIETVREDEVIHCLKQGKRQFNAEEVGCQGQYVIISWQVDPSEESEE